MIKIIFLIMNVFAQNTSNIGETVVIDKNSESYCDNKNKVLGDVCLMTQDKAMSYCFNMNSRLPTAKEYAQYAMSRGAIGIRILDQRYANDVYFNNISADDVNLISGQGLQKKNGSFNYSSKHFNSEIDKDPTWLSFFWTSSNESQWSENAYVFDGIYGGIGSQCKCCLNSVRCVINP